MRLVAVLWAATVLAAVAEAALSLDFDLELIESRTLDGHTQELIYRPTLHG